MIYYIQGFCCGLLPAFLAAVVIIVKRSITTVSWD